MTATLPALAAKRSVIFDLDGTLVDSSAAHASAFKRALAGRHPEIAREFDYERVRGMPTPAALSAIGIAEVGEVERLTRDKRAGYLEALAAGDVQPYPGACALVERLAASGRRLFMVTAASRRAAETVLDRLDLSGHFAFVLSAEELPGTKQSGRPFDLCVERFGLDRQTTLVVEDAADGVAGARAAGLDVVQVHQRAVPDAPFLPRLAMLAAAFGV